MARKKFIIWGIVIGVFFLFLLLLVFLVVFFPGETEWLVEWYSLTGDRKFGGKIGESIFPSTFLHDWKENNVYSSYSDYVGFIATAEIYAPRSGLFKFAIGSDDGSQLFIDYNLVLSNQWELGGMYSEKTCQVNLSEGEHNLRLEYWEKKGNAKVFFDCDHELLTW